MHNWKFTHEEYMHIINKVGLFQKKKKKINKVRV